MGISPMGVGQVLPTWTPTFVQNNGQPLVLGPNALVTTTIHNPVTGADVPGTGTWSILNANAGQARYAWGAADTAVAGTYQLYVSLQFLPGTTPSPQAGAPTTPLALGYYGGNAASLRTAGMLTMSVGSTTNLISHATTVGAGALGWGEAVGVGTTAAWTGAGSIGTPTGNGFLLDTAALDRLQVVAGTWALSLRASLSTSTGSLTADLTVRVYKWNTTGYTAIGSSTLAAQTLSNTWTTYTLPTFAAPAIPFLPGDRLYVDVWANISANTTGGTTVLLGDIGNGTTTIQHLTTPGTVPLATPALTLGPFPWQVQPVASPTWGGYALPPLHVAGTSIVTPSGSPVFLKGVNRFSYEFESAGDGHFAAADFAAMRGWGLNCVRIELSSAYWLGQSGTTPNYRANIAAAVAAATAAGLYIILNLQWCAPFPALVAGTDSGGGLYPMPDDSATTFWQQVAAAYGTQPNVLFDLYTEPHQDSSDHTTGWAVWQNGGTVTVTSSSPPAPAPPNNTYHTPGMQALVNTVRAVAPNTLLLIGGLGYAYDLSGILTGSALTGTNLIYSTHPYAPTDAQSQWQAKFLNTAAVYPVMAGEFGGDTTLADGGAYVQAVLAQFAALGTGAVAWEWSAPPGSLNLLNAWDGAPSAYGRAIHDFMVSH